jgi:tetratricopeptide (TPR) repeat protein
MNAPWKRTPRRKRGRYGNLIESIRERLRKEPGDLRLRQALATHLGQAGRYHEAIQEAERLLEIEPDHHECKRLLLGLRLHRLLRGGSAS